MILAKTRSTNPVMKAARGLLSREMPLVRRVRARGLVRYGVCTQSHACRRRRFLVLRGHIFRSPLAPSRRITIHIGAESGSAGPGTAALPRVPGWRWGHRTRIPLRSRAWRTSTTAHLPAPQAYMVDTPHDTPPPSAWPHTTHRGHSPSTSAAPAARHHPRLTPGRPPPAPGFIVRIRSLSASQALR